MKYTIVLEYAEDDGAYLVSVPAFPEVHTYGETADEAIVHAREAIQLAIEMYHELGRGLPEDPAVVVEVTP
jgi:predicted RNase H-like HicB family nuclease